MKQNVWLGKKAEEIENKTQNLDSSGNLTGTVTGNVTGNVTGDVTGDVTGQVFGTATTYVADGAIALTDTFAILDGSSATAIINPPVTPLRLTGFSISAATFNPTCFMETKLFKPHIDAP